MPPSVILPVPTELAATSSWVTSPLMMSADPTVFWPGSEPSTAIAVPPVRTRNSARKPAHWLPTIEASLRNIFPS